MILTLGLNIIIIFAVTQAFYCDDGSEISDALVCNGYYDCPWNSERNAYPDEAYCWLNGCPAGNIYCSYENICLAASSGKLCDGTRNCYHNEDEYVGCAPGSNCGLFEIACFDGETCILPTQICDGNVDCPPVYDSYGIEINVEEDEAESICGSSGQTTPSPTDYDVDTDTDTDTNGVNVINIFIGVYIGVFVSALY